MPPGIMDQLFSPGPKTINSKLAWLKALCNLHETCKQSYFPIQVEMHNPKVTVFNKEPLQIINLVVYTVHKGGALMFYLNNQTSSKGYYDIEAVPPFEEVKEVRFHPHYDPHYPPVAPDRKLDDFIQYMMKNFPKDEQFKVVLTFSHKVFIHPWASEPTDVYIIPTLIQELKRDDEKEYTYKVCFYVGRRNLFYYPQVIPIQHLVAITSLTNYVKPFRVRTSGPTVIRLTEKERKPFYYQTAIDWLEHDLGPYLQKLEIERTEHNCVLCGRETPSPAHFVSLLTNGYVVNTLEYPIKDRFIGYHPIGSECMKKVPNEFIFTAEAVTKISNPTTSSPEGFV